MQHYTNQLAKDTNEHLKDLSTMFQNLGLPSSEQRQYKILKERLTNDFSEALRNFQTTQRQAAQKERESVMRARAHSGLKGVITIKNFHFKLKRFTVIFRTHFMMVARILEEVI